MDDSFIKQLEKKFPLNNQQTSLLVYEPSIDEMGFLKENNLSEIYDNFKNCLKTDEIDTIDIFSKTQWWVGENCCGQTVITDEPSTDTDCCCCGCTPCCGCSLSFCCCCAPVIAFSDTFFGTDLSASVGNGIHNCLFN